MRRVRLLALTATVLCSFAGAEVSASEAAPALTLGERCDFPGVTLVVTGVAPNSDVSGSIVVPDGQEFFGSIPADETGTASTSLSFGLGLYTVKITSPFSTVESFEVDCLPNSREECKNGGWRSFGVFKNQGDCVSFVATKGKNPPGKETG
jgi:hypothetical protein